MPPNEPNEPCEFSESTYAFAFAREVVQAWHVPGFPEFASTVQEGAEGGGWDAAFDQEAGGVAYIQFKIPRWMQHGASLDADELGVPYLRIELQQKTEKQLRSQHQMLEALETVEDAYVIYAAPRFHRVTELADRWSNGTIYARSFCPYPSDLGVHDAAKHIVAYRTHGDQKVVHSDARSGDEGVGPGALLPSGFERIALSGRRLRAPQFEAMAANIINLARGPDAGSAPPATDAISVAANTLRGFERLRFVSRLVLSAEALPMRPPAPLPGTWGVPVPGQTSG